MRDNKDKLTPTCVLHQAMDREEKRKETGLSYYWYRTKVALGVAGTTPLQIK